MIQRAPESGARTASPRNRLSKEELATVSPMRSARREVQTGFFVLAGVLAVVIALFMLTDPGTLRGRYHVTTLVRDAGGIRKGDPVQMRGVHVGRVRGFVINPGGVLVSMELEKDYPVPRDSRVALKSNGLLGGLAADIIPGTSRETLENGDVLASAQTAGGLSEVAAGLGSRADTVLLRAQALLSEQTIGAVGTSATELQGLVTELSALASYQRGELAELSASLRRSAAGVEGAATRPELARSIARVDSITIRLDQTTSRLSAASTSLAGVLGRIDRGEGTLGKLSRDDELYVNLNQAATSMNQLVADIQKNPRKYINLQVF